MKIGDHIWEARLDFANYDGDSDEVILLEREIISLGAKVIKTKPVAWHRADGSSSKASGSITFHRLHGVSFHPALYRTRLEALNGLADAYESQATRYRESAEHKARDARTVRDAWTKLQAKETAIAGGDLFDPRCRSCREAAAAKTGQPRPIDDHRRSSTDAVMFRGQTKKGKTK